ncbi:PPR domain protein [Medicago truncatula]|uniref:PPR domain protein n=1 Tax=Medicago truncatula TaxID=3880 RepID=G7J0T4_MEDTR|nr:PPR domain protein [Medicago truncatula]
MGVTLDIKTFNMNMMIRSYGKAGMYDKIKNVDFMERWFFAPTIVTYNIVTEVYDTA